MLPYSEEYRPENQVLLYDKDPGRSVPLNPRLPPDFFTAPLDERDPQELNDWLDRPFICSIPWSDREASYREDRAQGFPDAYYEGHWTPDWWAAEGTDDEFEVILAELKARWLATFPDGNKYAVWVLRRNSPDQPPVCLRGYCANIADAVKLANAKPNRDGRYNVEIYGLLVQYWENPTPFEEY